jgi:hypothetical protein
LNGSSYTDVLHNGDSSFPKNILDHQVIGTFSLTSLNYFKLTAYFSGFPSSSVTETGYAHETVKLKVTKVDGASVGLEWNTLYHVQQYVLQYTTNQSSAWQTHNASISTSAKSVVVSNLTSSTTYKFQLKVSYSDGYSDTSNEVSAVTLSSNTEDTSQYQGTAAPVNSTSIKITLSSVGSGVNNINSWSLGSATTSGGNYTSQGTFGSSTTTYTVSGLSPNTAYYFKITVTLLSNSSFILFLEAVTNPS